MSSRSLLMVNRRPKWAIHRCLLAALTGAAGCLWLSAAAAEVSTTQSTQGEQRDDILVFHSGHQIRGVITAQDQQHLTLSTAGGLMVLPRERIAGITYGTSQPVGVLGNDQPRLTAAEQAFRRDLRLAQLAYATNDRARARSLLETHEQVLDLDGLRLLALLRDANKEIDSALELYRRYEQNGGTDTKTLTRKRSIERAIQQHQQELKDYYKKYDLTPPEQSTTNDPQTPSGPQIMVKNGLESDQGWKAEKVDFANPSQVWIIDHPDLAADKLLQIDCEAGNKWKAAAFRSVRFNGEQNPIVAMDIFNDGKRSVAISLAIKTGSRHEYYESLAKQIPAGKEWHSLRFDLRDETFKSQIDNFRQHSHGVRNLSDIRELQIQVHNRQRKTTVVANNIFIIDDSQPDVIRVPEPMQESVPEPTPQPNEPAIPGVTE